MKNAWLAAILNFFTIGLGTVYVGKRPIFGLLLAVGAGGLLRYEEIRIAPAMTGTLSLHWVFAMAGLTLLGLATAVDAYREARAS